MVGSYPRFIIKSPSLLPPSRLSSLEPIGVGTPTVESLSSYIYRLAMAHCWTITNLFGYEIMPLLNKPYISKRSQSKSMSSSIMGKATRWFERINSGFSATSKLTAAIEGLTLRNDLNFLSFVPWSRVLPTIHLTRSYRAWCPDCFKDWNASGSLIYEPLLGLCRLCKFVFVTKDA
jgi:hypothetical protein